jgi:hypothetical protein
VFYLNIRKVIIETSNANVIPLLLLRQDHHHDLGNLKPAVLEPRNTIHIKVLDVEVIYIVLGVSRKELLVVKQTECQALKTLVETFDVLLTCFPLPRWKVPVKDITSISHLFFSHILMIAPDAGLYEVDFHLLLVFVLHRKPDIAIAVQLVDKLEERAGL